MTVHASSLSIALLVEVILVLLQPFCDSETKKKKKTKQPPGSVDIIKAANTKTAKAYLQI